MPFVVPLSVAQTQYPEYSFVSALTPSAHKAAFHVRDAGGRDLCLKLISPSAELSRVQREVQALRQLDHPGVAKLVDYTFQSSAALTRHHIVEEFVEGSDLVLPGNSSWSDGKIIDVFGQLFSALEALRAQEIVHRDIKPGNIRVSSSGKVVLIDFGLARMLALSDLTATVQGARLGTMMYFSPEQCDGTKRDIDHRTDLFAVGVLLYQAATGRHPFYESGDDPASLFKKIKEQSIDVTALQGLSKPLRVLVSKLLEKPRSRRIQTAVQAGTLLGRTGESE